MLRDSVYRRLGSLAVGCMALLVAAEARATVPCEEDEPCHNNFAEPIIMYAMGAEAFGVGFVGMVGNAASLNREAAPGVGWLSMGYVGAIYNYALGLTWSALAGQSLTEFPDDDYAKSQLALGVSHLVMGSVTLGVTIAAQLKRAGTTTDTGFVMVPGFVPAPGGGSLVLAGEF